MNKKSGRASTSMAIDISNLRNCVDDACKAGLDGDNGPEDPTDYNQLMGRLAACRGKLPPLYQAAFYEPFLDVISGLGQANFTQILLKDPDVEGFALLMFDIAQAILQKGEGYNEKATDAFQEVLSDLYDGFLSEEDRRNVKKPDYEVIPPLAKWGRAAFGPYTCPIAGTRNFGVKAATVNLPPANARCGLFAWAALGHETAGHDILAADEGLIEELASSVKNALAAGKLDGGLQEYWSIRIDESASDILGILNMGPAAAFGMIGFFRGLNLAYGGSATLRNGGDEDDYHPSDIIRGYLAASAIRLLKFDRAGIWADIIETETKKDASTILLEGRKVDFDKARRSAQIVASVIVNGTLESLENHSLGQIQNWRNTDEAIVKKLSAILSTPTKLPSKIASGFYAAHVVSAATISAAEKDADIQRIFDRMLTILQEMHHFNNSWGPIYIIHPGNLAPRFAYHRNVGEGSAWLF